VYRVTRSFPKEELYGLTSQIRRASASIGANLAEGCGRRSERELARFVHIAMGSASELDYELVLARDLGLLTNEEHRTSERSFVDLRKMLTGLVESVQSA
jgi:four helix bundle protein